MNKLLQRRIDQAHLQSDVLSALGRMINHARTRTWRGRLLGMLSVEVALRKGDVLVAKRVLGMARQLLTDEYRSLVKCGAQSYSIGVLCDMTSFERHEIIEKRSAQWQKRRNQ